MSSRASSFFQFIIGFFLGIIILAGGTTALAYVFLSRMSAPPAKPLFAGEKSEEPATTAKGKSGSSSASEEKATASSPKTDASAASQAKAASEEPEEKLPPGAYKARVTWNEGLSVRAEPSSDAARIGGVAYNKDLVILGYSDDRKWQKIRLPGSDSEGWIKAGNVEKIEAE